MEAWAATAASGVQNGLLKVDTTNVRGGLVPLSGSPSGWSTLAVGPVGYRLRALLRSGRAASIALAVVVALTAAVVLALVAGAARTLSAPHRFETSNGLVYDVFAQQDGLEPPRTDEVARLDGVRWVEGASFTFGGLLPAGADAPLDDVFVFSGEPLALNARLAGGRAARTSSEFVVNREYFEAQHARLGQRFHLKTLTREEARKNGFDADPSKPPVAVTLVGVMEGTAGLGDGSNIALFPPSLLKDGDVGNASTLYAIDLDPGTSLADLRSSLSRLGGSPFTVQEPEIIPKEFRTAVKAQGTGYVVFAAIAALASIVVVGQLLSRQFRLDGEERTVLRSLGFTRIQLVAEPLARSAVPLVAGVLVAVPIAYLASGLFPRGFVKAVEPHSGLLLQPAVLLLVAVAFALGTLVVVWIASLASGVDRAMLRRTSWIDRLSPQLRNVPAGLGVRFAFAKTSSRDRSVVAPLVGLSLITVLLLGALTFGDNLRTLIDRRSRWGINYDMSVGQGGTVDPARLDPLIKGSDLAADVDAVTIYGSSSVSAGDLTLQLIVLRSLKGQLGPEVLSGRLPSGPEEIALGRVAARHLHVGVGDTLDLETKGGRRMRVVGTIIPTSSGGIELNQDAAAVDEQGGAALGAEYDTSVAAIRLAPGAPADTAARVRKATGSDLRGGEDPPAAITNLDRVRGIPFLVAGLAAVLAFATLGHQVFMAARRRRPDLAVLRALGVSGRGLGAIVHWQASLTILAVLVVSVPLGAALGSVVYRTFPDQMGAATTTALPWGTLALAGAGMLVLANLIVVVPARQVSRLVPGSVRS